MSNPAIYLVTDDPKPEEIHCPRCGGVDVDYRAHTFDQCIGNLRRLLRKYRDHIVEAEGSNYTEWFSPDGDHENMTEVEADFIQGLDDA